MSRFSLLRALALSSGALLASAAGGGLRPRALEPSTPSAFLAELFERSSTCAPPHAGGGAVTRVLAEQGFCQRQGDTASFAVACAADGRSGTLTSCSDAACRANCDSVPFISGACTAPRSIAGAFAPAASVTLSCLAAPPQPRPVECGRCVIEYSVRPRAPRAVRPCPTAITAASPARAAPRAPYNAPVPHRDRLAASSPASAHAGAGGL
jgi:hypothetical protein